MIKIKDYLIRPWKILLTLDSHNIIRLNDEKYIKYCYKEIFNKDFDLKNPQTFNEKLQWLKLYNRNPEYTKMVDKYEVKDYIANKIGKEYVIPTLGIYDNFDDIDFNKLPNQFVMKCTHDSGSTIVCKDKEKFNINNAKNKINKCLKKNFYYASREWPYKDVKPRIIIEEYMEDNFYNELIDYKIYSFNGKCDYVMACFDRNIDKVKFIYFDKNWNIKKELSNDGIKYGDNIKNVKPKNLEKMFKFAEKLSQNIPFVRVDFYESNGKLYFGELTFFPSGGFDNTRTQKMEEYLNSKLILD